MAYSYYEGKTAPALSWREARRAIRTGRPTGSLYALQLLAGPMASDVSDVPLMGTHHNEARIKRLFRAKPDGHDHDGRPWKVGVLYPAPDDPCYQFTGLIGVVSVAGHLGCMMPGYHYIRPFIEALSQRDMHFVVAVNKTDDDDVTIPFLRGRTLRESLQSTAPTGITWEWPPWPEEAFTPLPDEPTASSESLVKSSAGHVRGRHYTEFVEPIRDLKRNGDTATALELLYECIAAAERDRNGREPAPWFTHTAAVLHRQQKDYDAEVSVLERWDAACPRAQRGPGATQAKIAERLVKARQLRALGSRTSPSGARASAG